MGLITLRLSEDLLKKTDKFAEDGHLSRAEYVRKALEKMNRSMMAERMDRQIKRASLKVRAESMAVNDEFSQVEYFHEHTPHPARLRATLSRKGRG
jgi:metal-responsive CopG/Arc/MetJ family transcriptional regulator